MNRCETIGCRYGERKEGETYGALWIDNFWQGMMKNAFPQDTAIAGSCRNGTANYCGIPFYEQPCQCEASCKFFGDCCSDFDETCAFKEREIVDPQVLDALPDVVGRARRGAAEADPYSERAAVVEEAAALRSGGYASDANTDAEMDVDVAVTRPRPVAQRRSRSWKNQWAPATEAPTLWVFPIPGQRFATSDCTSFGAVESQACPDGYVPAGSTEFNDYSRVYKGKPLCPFGGQTRRICSPPVDDQSAGFCSGMDTDTFDYNTCVQNSEGLWDLASCSEAYVQGMEENMATNCATVYGASCLASEAEIANQLSLITKYGDLAHSKSYIAPLVT